MTSSKRPVPDADPALPLLNARRWALGFLAFAVVLAVIFSQLLIEFIAQAQ
ncbi:hypothetical protein LWC35_14775 [Pseudonocardia kujensis]|uniref:hypothetical protein n=1 Tax=Pseudonocardia kujensis TaxID=1128675 RepID=UPI001E2E7C2D|nr:hypothetical protein [Pseudonocardia kujensis]MCE0764165.1 hypothetical protein [Pseudonocardia kujensis]